MESRPVHSTFTPKEVITDVTTQGVTSVTNRVKIHSIFFFLRVRDSYETALREGVAVAKEVGMIESLTLMSKMDYMIRNRHVSDVFHVQAGAWLPESLGACVLPPPPPSQP